MTPKIESYLKYKVLEVAGQMATELEPMIKEEIQEETANLKAIVFNTSTAMSMIDVIGIRLSRMTLDMANKPLYIGPALIDDIPCIRYGYIARDGSFKTSFKKVDDIFISTAEFDKIYPPKVDIEVECNDPLYRRLTADK